MCWVKYFRRVQLEKTTRYLSTIGMTSFKAIFNKKPCLGLSDVGMPSELLQQFTIKGFRKNY